MDHLGLEQAVDRLRQGIVVRVADAADRGLDASFREPLGILIETAWVILNCAEAWLGNAVPSMSAGVSTALKPDQ